MKTHRFWKRRPPGRHRHHPYPQPIPTPVPQPIPVPQPPTPVPTPPSPGPVVSWPTFTGTAQFVGTSAAQQVSVYVDPTLGSQGLDAAQALLTDADRVAILNNAIFGVSGVNPVNVIVFALGGATDGTGGADHAACSFGSGGNIEVDISIGSPARVSSLFEAELSECAMNGQLCGLSTGEALSRWCAMVTDNNALADFVTVPQWVQAGMPDYVNQIDPTDQDGVSIGCGMAFLSWMMADGKITLPSIAQEMVKLGDSGTFAMLYSALALTDSAWVSFQAAVTALPASALNTDDPFNALAGATASV